MIEFFLGNRTERQILRQKDALLSKKPNLNKGDSRKLTALEPQVDAISRRLFCRRVGGVAGALALVATSVISVVDRHPLFAPEQKATDLDLQINDAEFWNVIRGGSRVGIITQTEDRNKMDHLESLGDLWVAESSPSFRLAINRPMADFMFRQADLAKPSLPTRIIFWESWLDKSEGEDTGAFTSIHGSDQVIVISLKMAAHEAFLDLERKGLPIADYFAGALSYFISRYMAHEMAHAGRQTKRLTKKGEALIPDALLNATHPQIYAFDQKYTKLYSQASLQRRADAALIFVANLETGIDLPTYRTQLLQEARSQVIIK